MKKNISKEDYHYLLGLQSSIKENSSNLNWCQKEIEKLLEVSDGDTEYYTHISNYVWNSDSNFSIDKLLRKFKIKIQNEDEEDEIVNKDNINNNIQMILNVLNESQSIMIDLLNSEIRHSMGANIINRIYKYISNCKVAQKEFNNEIEE